MRTSICFFILLGSLFLTWTTPIFPQGSLTPPGGPTPTMKSLDQIEARTPISSVPFTINNYGSYYLTKNLNVSSGSIITVATTGVTLDLNGFTLSSVASPANGSAILISSGVQEVTIKHGHIIGGVTYNGSSFTNGPGFVNGISLSGTGYNIHVQDVTISGCSGNGINLGTDYSNVIDHCDVRTVGLDGIHGGVVENCTAVQCGGNGINSIVTTNCYGTAVSSGHGVYSFTANNCQGISVSGNGINSLTATGCYGTSSSGAAVVAHIAANCYGSANNASGIMADVANGCEGSTLSGAAVNATTANNCQGATGNAGYGISAYMANNCLGQSFGSGYGMYVINVAVGSYGYSSSGTGLFSNIANSCLGEGGSGATPEVITHKYNMP